MINKNEKIISIDEEGNKIEYKEEHIIKYEELKDYIRNIQEDLMKEMDGIPNCDIATYHNKEKDSVMYMIEIKEFSKFFEEVKKADENW